MKRRTLLACGVAALALPALAARAQRRLPRIGYLLLGSVTEPPSRERQAFLDGLRERGYVPGKTIEILYASAENDPGFLDTACRELVAKKPDLIAVSGAEAVLAAKTATSTIPIVMLAIGDPEAIGAVQSLARPGGNITGASFLSSDLASKRLELMRAIVPRAKRVMVLWARTNPNAQAEARAAIEGVRTLGLVPDGRPVDTDREVVAALEAMGPAQTDVLYVAFSGGLIASNRTLIAESAIRHRVPALAGWSFFAEAGGLMSYAPDIPATFHRGAYYVERILKGAKPADLPIELPTRVEFVLNLKTARALGLKIPKELLLRADRVIE
jgi:putative ABC transport system substrate-binding protein